MNKQIEKLALKCGAWNQVYEPNRFLHDHNFDIKMFAELIVQECANMAESFHHHQYDFTGNLELHEFIKEHVGLEP